MPSERHRLADAVDQAARNFEHERRSAMTRRAASKPDIERQLADLQVEYENAMRRLDAAYEKRRLELEKQLDEPQQ